MREMSPQAYRRLREKMTIAELRDLATDISNMLMKVGATKTSMEDRITHLLVHVSPYTKLAHGVYVRVIDEYAGTENEFRGYIQRTADGDDWYVRRDSDGELAGPYDDSELERVE